jgi:hypothetical protein
MILPRYEGSAKARLLNSSAAALQRPPIASWVKLRLVFSSDGESRLPLPKSSLPPEGGAVNCVQIALIGGEGRQAN